MSVRQQETDEELLARYQNGEVQVADLLIDRYRNLVRKKANTLFLFGGDTDDLIQEGMIGLFKAIQRYRPEKGSFFSFAQTCMNHQMYHAIESAARKKHAPLNSYVSLSAGERPDEIDPDGDWAAAGDWQVADAADPEQILIDRESVEQTLTEIKNRLSAMEQAVLDDYLNGLNYRQIAEKMGKPPKVVDNALQRIRAKVQKMLQGETDAG